jgi:hypothetical protein
MAADSTYEAIATQTLASTANSITFSSIPGTYTDLVILAIGQSYTSPSYGNLQLQFNGDSGTNYSSTEFKELGGNVSSNRRTSQSNLFATSFLDWGTANQNVGHSIVNIFNYSNTTTFKSVLSRGNIPGFKTEFNAGLWRSTTAITSINVSVNDTPINIGSIFTLYGIKAA